MATKKQKHEQALAKRKAREAALRESGLKAQKADRARRDSEARVEWQKTHDSKHFKFVDECPICSEIKKDVRSEKAKTAIAKMPKPPSTEEIIDQMARESAERILEDNSSVELECI